MELTFPIFVKLVILGFIWIVGWCFHFASYAAPTTLKNVSIAFAPFFVFLLYIFIFWW